MIHWFLRDSQRLKQERAGIEKLSRTVPWLIGTEWCLDGGLCLDTVVRAHGHDYDLRVSFPALFPDAPITVRPRKVPGLLSTHQYGTDGPLCLEWGPDNWHRDVTAVQMLESAHCLLDIENPLGQARPEIPVVAPSRHKLTAGQELRTQWCRWYLSRGFNEFINAQPASSVGSFKFSFRDTDESWSTLIHEAKPIDGLVWKDTQIPTSLPDGKASDLRTGIWFRTNLDTLGQPKTLGDLKEMLASHDGHRMLATDGSSPIEGFKNGLPGILVIDCKGEYQLYIVLSDETLIKCTTVCSENDDLARAPDGDQLSAKKIGIVGLGSVGSKIGITLARMGARKFYLVDHDLLLPENLKRHALDWQSVTQHKANAMASAITSIAPDAIVEIRRLHLVGQESNASVSGALDKLAECDLIIDATACQRTFNLLAAIARTAQRPMVWAEVFGGGIGGLVARSRPGVDPAPQDMRGAFLQFCDLNPDTAVTKPKGGYAVEGADGKVLVASDADVAIIAHHAARFVPDCFFNAAQSKFPESMYLVGLAKAWVFESPFVNIPISTASFSTNGWSKGNDAEISPETAAFVIELLGKVTNATPTDT